GAGSSGDPYVISGLNITFAGGINSIDIDGVTVHYVIRDCYIYQGSSDSWGIFLWNASNGLVEHNTIISDGGGLTVIECNDTAVNNNNVTNYGDGMFQFGVYAGGCWDLILEWNVFFTPDNVVAGFDSCLNLLMNNNYFEGGDSMMPCLSLYECNGTVANHNTLEMAYYGLMMDGCFNSAFNNLTTVGLIGYGISIVDCHEFDLSNSYFDTLAICFIAEDCTNVTATNSEFLYGGFSGDFAIDFLNVDNVDISGNTIEGGNAAIGLESCEYVVVDSNTIFNEGDMCIYVRWSYLVSITGNTMDAFGEFGIFIEQSGEITIGSNEIIGDYAEANIYLDDVFNGTIIGNTLDRMASGVYFHWCTNWTASGNTVSEGLFAFFGEENILISLDNNIINDNVFGFGMFDVTDIEISYNELNNILDQAWMSEFTVNMSIHHNTVDTCVGVGYNDMAVNTTFNYNTITNCEYQGMGFDAISNGQVIGNEISSPVDGGLVFGSNSDFTISDNVLTDCGIVFETGLSLASYNQTLSNNLVNGQPIYYSVSEEDATIDSTNYGQIILVNGTTIDITGKSWGRCTIPIQLFYTDVVDIPGVITTNNWKGIQAYLSNNITITDFTSSGHESTGVSLDTCDYFYIEGLSQTGGDNGIQLVNCDFGTIYLSTFNLADNGIRATSGSSQYGIYNCEFTGLENAIFGNGDDVKVSNCYIFNSTYGIHVNSGDNWNITENIIEYGHHGIWVENSAHNGFALLNEIYGVSHHGMLIQNSNNWEIMNNTILWSGVYGIWLLSSPGTEVYYNVIGLSGDENGRDSTAQNWDDGVDTGNWWSDYDGVSATYSVDSGTDNYPMQFLPETPLIDYPIDFSYAEGSTGNIASWIVFDNYLSHYRVTVDGVVVIEDAFAYTSEDTVTVDIDGLPYGDHTIIVTVWDIEDNTATDTVMVHVYDDTDPTINTPPNMELFVGGSDQEIVWTVNDLNPDSYEVLLDEATHTSGSWDNGELTINVDGLSEGEHTLRLTVSDVDGNSVSDSVLVLVINDETNPIIDSPDDLMFVVGTTGNSLVWTPVDEYPATYEISSNGSVYISGDWGGSRVVLDVDGLPVGNHTFTLTVWDGSGNSVSDEVIVVVIPYEGWTAPLEPLDATLAIIGLAVAGGVIAVVVIVYFLKIKKPSS
ncbi:MAG: right-handed parallel beta-helix repeat-containing protein, partial [Candidatus Thorarchaeota archaeon]